MLCFTGHGVRRDAAIPRERVLHPCQAEEEAARQGEGRPGAAGVQARARTPQPGGADQQPPARTNHCEFLGNIVLGLGVSEG